MADVLISVQNLVRVYGRRSREVKALDIQRLDLARGDFVAVTGPSGCGKTTFLNLLGALDRPSRGSIFFEGRDLAGLGEAGLCRYRREKAGFIFQAYCLIPSLTALQNVLAPVYPRGNGRRMRERARELLRRLGLAGVEKRRPGELSGGEQQRVAIARALVGEAPLILADEPTGNLDTKTSEEIMNLFTGLNGEGKTIILVTHEPDVAEYSRRTLVFRDGRLIDDERREGRA